MDNLSELLAKHVQQHADRTALATSDLATVISYRRLEMLVREAMAQLWSLGLRKGNTVALVADNCVEFAVGLLAGLSSGARLAPLNPALTPPQLRTSFSRLAAHAVLLPERYAERLDLPRSSPGCPIPWVIRVNGSGNASSVSISELNRPGPGSRVEPPFPIIKSEDVALVMFTAGSTSEPKAVPLTHGNIVESIRTIARVYRLSPQDATLIVMPLFHGHGLIAGLLATLESGGAAYLPSTGVFSAHTFWPDMIRVNATWYTAVPTIHRILVNRAPHEYPGSAPSLRFIRSCSAPLDEELARDIAHTFGVPVIAAYGMTETCHQTTSNPLPQYGSNKTASVGPPSGIEIRIVGADGTDAEGDGVGEVWVRGATLTPGYLNNPAANAENFVHGWFRTGDLGSRDIDGYLYLRGRLKEIINRGGEKISPGDVDATLLSNPDVLEAASFGEPDPMYGENVQAAVVLRPGATATENQLQDYCRTKLGRFEVPERIHIVAGLPRTAKGSIDRRALAAQFSPHTL